ncbi:hypothetical protein B9479_007936 [Cryptococcus floricola]|uniref:C3H1-type domain-containing protein n=1 Tax=Cryptococcus floricola TaxID=2591691 RepID=A0A5D3AM73_9TREE|nr:hypothetical protein B9479_007936 [Cryptococcus floricola]
MTSSSPITFDFYNNPHGAIGQPSPSIANESSLPPVDYTTMATHPQGAWHTHHPQLPPKTPAHGERGDVSHPRPEDEAWDRITLSAHVHSQGNPVMVDRPKTAAIPGYQPFIDNVASPLSTPTYRAPQGAYYIPSPKQAPPTPTQQPARTANDTAMDVARHLDSLRGLLGPLISEADQVEKLKKEVEMWKGEWSKGEKDRRGLEERIGVLEVEKSAKKPVGPMFTAVLIDGDGLIFRDSYLQSGFAGGQLAARHLLTSIPSLSSPTSSDPAEEVTLDINGLRIGDSDTKAGGQDGVEDDTGVKELKSIVVQVFLNKAGLGGALLKAGIIPSWTVYEQFWQGFSSSHELFTVCDVGPGKEGSDAKIREYLKLYSRNAQCESIILGASHDNGYANVLSSLNTESRLSNLLLLKGYNTLAHQLRAYSSRVVSIPDLFRQEKVPYVHGVAPKEKEREKDKAEKEPIQIVEKKVTSFSSIVAASSKPAPSSQPTKPTKKAPVATPIPGPPSPSYSSESEDEELEVYHWGSGVQSRGADGSETSDSPEKAVSAKVQPPWKKKQDDLKSLLSKPATPTTTQSINKKFTAVPDSGSSAGGWEKVVKKQAGAKPGKVGPKGEEVESSKKAIKNKREAQEYVRRLHPRPCHTHFLGAKGCTNDNCHYGHSYSLSSLHLEELARLAKCIMCPYVKSGKCKYGDAACVYGHRCPNPEACVFGDTCRFYELANGHGELD